MTINDHKLTINKESTCNGDDTKIMKMKAPDKKKECGICTGLIFTVLCPSCKLCSRRFAIMTIRNKTADYESNMD